MPMVLTAKLRRSNELLVTVLVAQLTVAIILCSAYRCGSSRNVAGLPILRKITASSSPTFQNCSSSSSMGCNTSSPGSSYARPEKTPLYFVVMAPYPDCPPLNPSWEGGPAVVPAAIVAKDLINEKEDILKDYTIELIVNDTGCNVSTKAVNSFLYSLFYSGKNIAGIIGPGCSESALAVAPQVTDERMSLIQIAPTATSPNLTNTSRFTNTFRPIESALGFVKFHLSLIVQKKYVHVGALYEVNRPFQSTVYARFERAVLNKGVRLTSFGLFDQHFPLKEFRSRIRVIFVFASTDFARQVLCAAIIEGLLFPEYQFIFSNRKESSFRTNVTYISGEGKRTCDEEQMMSATKGMVFADFRLVREDRDNPLTAAGISYDEFSERYKIELERHLDSINASESIDTSHHSNYFDATWALALSLNNSLSHLDRKDLSLSNYAYQMPEITKIVNKELLKLSFEGMRGRVQFSKDTHDGAGVTIFDVYQVSESYDYGRIGYLDPSSGLNIFDNASLIDAHFDRRPHISLGIVVTVIVLFLFLALISCQVANVVWGSHKNIKATSPNLNHLIYSGCYLSLVAAIMYTNIFVFIDVPVTSESDVFVPVHCSTLQWSCTMMYSLVFGTLCAKRWRIHRIFKTFRSSPIKYVGDGFLISMALSPLVVDVIVNVLWNSIDPWHSNPMQSDQLSTCQTRNEIVWGVLVAVPKIVLTAVVLYLAIVTRRVHKKEFKQTKSINILIYTLVILTGVLLPVFFILQTSNDRTPSRMLATLSYLIFCIFDIGFVVPCIVLVLLPPLVPSIKTKLLKRPPKNEGRLQLIKCTFPTNCRMNGSSLACTPS